MFARFASALMLAIWLAPAATAAPTTACRYDVRQLDPAADLLEVTVRCDGPGPHRLGGGRGFRADAADPPAALPGSELVAEEGRLALRSAEGTAALRYRFRLGELAARAGNADVAQRYGRSVVTTLPVWLLAPAERDLPLALAVSGPTGTGFASALAATDGTFRLRSGEVRFGGYVVFGSFRASDLDLPGPGALPHRDERAGAGDVRPAALRVALADAPMALSEAEVVAWVRDSAGVLAAYAGGFPAARVLVSVLPQPGGRGVRFGRVMGGGGPAVIVLVGRDSTREDLYGAWVLVHELVHVGMPFVYDDAAWLMEGFATYVEPVARARAGWVTPEALWGEFVEGMPRGLDAFASGGLRNAGRGGIYWGGGLLALLADIGYRQASGGGFGLEDCLRALAEAGGDSSSRWSVAETAGRCDGAAGSPVLAGLVAERADRGRPFDLDGLWRELGVRRIEGGIAFDDAAPLAAIRRAIGNASPTVPPATLGGDR